MEGRKFRICTASIGRKIISSIRICRIKAGQIERFTFSIRLHQTPASIKPDHPPAVRTQLSRLEIHVDAFSGMPALSPSQPRNQNAVDLATAQATAGVHNAFSRLRCGAKQREGKTRNAKRSWTMAHLRKAARAFIGSACARATAGR